MNRLVQSMSAVAVESSEFCCTTLYHMLRLAFYLEGDTTVNMTKEEVYIYEMESGIGRYRRPKDEDDQGHEEISDSHDVKDTLK